MTQIILNRLTDQVLIWRSTPSVPEYHRKLPKIADWWSSLAGKTVQWELFDNPRFCSTAPLLSHRLVIESTQFKNNALYWTKLGSSQMINIPIKEAVVDLVLQQIEFVPHRQHPEYVPTCRYRVKLVPTTSAG